MNATEPSAAAPFSWLTFVAAGGLVVLYAVSSGTYDLVTRQEFALVVWWILGLGLVTGIIVPLRCGVIAWVPAIALLGLLGWTVLSLGWTGSTERTVAELARVASYLGVLVLVSMVVQPEASRSAILGATAGAAGICALALVDRLTGGGLTSSAVTTRFGAQRLNFPLDYWNALGVWAAMTLVVALAASTHERRRVVRALTLALVPMAAAAAYLTYSRTTVVVTIIGIVSIVVFARHRWATALHAVFALAASTVVVVVIRANPAIADGLGSSGGWAVALAIMAAMTVCGGAAAALSGRPIATCRLPTRIGRPLASVGVLLLVVGSTAILAMAWPTIERQFDQRDLVAATDPAQRLTSLNGNRKNVWASALEAGTTHPWSGVGPGTFELWWNRDARDPEFVRDAHSLYLEAFAELGWPGLLLVATFAFSLIAITATSRRRAPPSASEEAGVRTGVLAVALIWVVAAGVDWMWELTALTVLALVLVGSAGAALRGTARPLHPAMRLGLGAVALMACLIQLPGMVSTSELRDSQAAAARGDIEQAVLNAREARQAAPWAISPIMQEGLLAEATGQFTEAERLLRRASAGEPGNYVPLLLLARVEAKRGDVDAARRAYRAAKRLRPLSPVFTGGQSATTAPERREGG